MKIQQMNIYIFWNQNLLELIFFLVDTNQDVNSKIFKNRRYYLPKGIIKTITLSSMDKTL